MPEENNKLLNNEHTRNPFPVWLRELLFLGGIIVSLTLFGANLKSDQRSTNEKLVGITKEITAARDEITAVRGLLPNKEVLDIRLDGIDEKMAQLRSDLNFEIAKAQKFREDLLRKGMVE